MVEAGETFRIRSDYDGDEMEFSFQFWVDEAVDASFASSVTVWVLNGHPFAEVFDQDGNAVECGHQRPADIARNWEADTAAARKRSEERSS